MGRANRLTVVENIGMSEPMSRRPGPPLCGGSRYLEWKLSEERWVSVLTSASSGEMRAWAPNRSDDVGFYVQL